MGFVLDGLDAEDYDRDYSDGALVGRILGYFRPQARKMAVVASVVVLGALAEVADPDHRLAGDRRAVRQPRRTAAAGHGWPGGDDRLAELAV